MTLSLVSVLPASGPWAVLCEDALVRHTPEVAERVPLDPSAVVSDLLERTSGRFVAVVDPALGVPPRWAEHLVQALEASGAGAVGPVRAHATGEQHGPASYQDVAGFLAAAQRRAEAAEPPRPVQDLDPGCFVVTRAAIAALDPATPVLAIPRALRNQGWTLLVAPSVLVHAFGDYFTHDRRDLVRYVPSEARAILDVGCGAGRLGRQLKERAGVRVIGIEADAGAAAAARGVLDDVFECDVDRGLPALAPDSFDCLVFADVLEHLRDPWAVLKGLAASLRPGGTVVACIPNVRHWSVVRGLLEGDWRYAPAGLLDQSHLRFFTRRTAEELFERAGLVVRRTEALHADESGAELDAAVAALQHQGLSLDTLAAEGRVVQFVVVAERPRVAVGG